MKRILIIEDEPTSALILQQLLEADDISIAIAETGYEALEDIQRETPDIILLDLGLPDTNGLDLIKDIQAISAHSDIIVVTGEASVDSALKAIKLGARDYIVKPIEHDRLHVSIQNAFDRIRISQDILKIQGRDKGFIGFHDMVGKSGNMRELYKTIDIVSKCDDPILMQGEHGTGKTLCARTIHSISNRSNKPLVTFNCLTGHAKNSEEPLKDALSKANGGSLYLSHINALDARGQALLLTSLDSEDDVRFIFSSLTPLEMATQDGSFREDLYYRINVLPIEIPALRQRGNDIQLMAQYLLSSISAEKGEAFCEFDDLSLLSFSNHHWPGNIRELENLIRRVMTLHSGETIVTSAMLPQTLMHVPENTSQDNFHANQNQNIFSGSDIIAIRDLERMAIEHALNMCDGNVQEAASHLKISPATLYRKKPTHSYA